MMIKLNGTSKGIFNEYLGQTISLREKLSWALKGWQQEEHEDLPTDER
jgi:hypothetical protein